MNHTHFPWRTNLQTQISFKAGVARPPPIRCCSATTPSTSEFRFRTFCSKKFRQSLLFDRFGFVCGCAACSLDGPALHKDDWCRSEIDKLAQKFAQVRTTCGGQHRSRCNSTQNFERHKTFYSQTDF